MTLKKISIILMILRHLTLTGAVLAVSAAQEGLQPTSGSEAVLPTAIRFAETNERLESYFPEDIEVIGRYDATIDPTANFTIEPINRDSPLEVKRNTPIGALDAVAQSAEMNYTTYYYRPHDAVYVSSINEFEEDPERDLIWFTFWQINDTYVYVHPDSLNHTLSDGETFWLIFCDLSEYDPTDPRDFRAYWTVAGLSITVTFGEENVTPGQNGNVTSGQNGNATPGQTPVEQMGLGEVIGEDANLSILAALISVTDLTAALQGEGPYTVFAPENDAFESLTPDILAGIFTDEEERTRVLSNHVVNGSYPTAELLNMTQDGNTTTLTTLAGTDLTVTASGSVLMVDNATVIGPENNTSNGVVQVIDAVLLPPENQTTQPAIPTVNATEQPTPLVNMTGIPEGTL